MFCWNKAVPQLKTHAAEEFFFLITTEELCKSLHSWDFDIYVTVQPLYRQSHSDSTCTIIWPFSHCTGSHIWTLPASLFDHSAIVQVVTFRLYLHHYVTIQPLYRQSHSDSTCIIMWPFSYCTGSHIQTLPASLCDHSAIVQVVTFRLYLHNYVAIQPLYR